MIRDSRLYHSMGYWIGEPSIINPQIALKAISELAAQGYDVVRLFVREGNFTHRSSLVVSLVKQIVEHAHELNTKIVMDCEPHGATLGSDMGREFPGKMGSRLVLAKTAIVRGHFVLHIHSPSGCAPAPRFAGFEAAFVKNGNKVSPIHDLEYNWRHEVEHYDTGYTSIELPYSPGRPFVAPRIDHLSGRLSKELNGELITYLRYDDDKLIDFWSQATRDYYDSLIECYKGIHLDGMGWDEPAAECSWANYRYGKAFAKAFETLNGYSLRDRLYLLDEPQLTPNAVQVRLDYYRCLNEGLFIAQKHFIERVKTTFCDDSILGTHHTWVGEGGIGDYRAGAVDYFRLNENMDAGYTDTSWYFNASVCYTYVLAASLGRLTKSGTAECNTWHWKPTIANTDYATRFMALMRINWFNIWYGDTCDTAKYPEHYSYQTCLSGLKRLDRFKSELVNTRPVVDIAIWHGWEGVCASNSPDLAFAHKDCMLYVSETLVNQNIPFDFIDSKLISNAVIKNERLVTALESYKVLIMPYATVIPSTVWDRCVAFTKAGGKIIFIGPPAQQTVEGKNLQSEFALLTGIQHLSFSDFWAHVTSHYILPTNGPQPLDVFCQLDVTDGSPIYSTEGQLHGSIGPSGNVYYLSELVPMMPLANLLKKLIAPQVTCYSDNILWRLYQESDALKLMLIAKQSLSMSGIIRFAGKEFEIRSGKIALITRKANGDISVQGEDLDWQYVR